MAIAFIILVTNDLLKCPIKNKVVTYVTTLILKLNDWSESDYPLMIIEHHYEDERLIEH